MTSQPAEWGMGGGRSRGSSAWVCVGGVGWVLQSTSVSWAGGMVVSSGGGCSASSRGGCCRSSRNMARSLWKLASLLSGLAVLAGVGGAAPAGKSRC